MSDEKTIPTPQPELLQAPAAPAPDMWRVREAARLWAIWSGPRPGEPNRPPYAIGALD